MKNTNDASSYWSKKYEEANTGWDIGYPSTPIKTYIDQLKDKSQKILIPGAGNAYEAEYLFKSGFSRVDVVDIAQAPLTAFAQRNPDFPKAQLICADFFEHQGEYDLILEQTFFCAFPPTTENRSAYAKHMHDLLVPEGTLSGLWFDFPLVEKGPPFGGSKQEYLGYFQPYFEILTFEKAYNSIKPRMGNELFGIFRKKE